MDLSVCRPASAFADGFAAAQTVAKGFHTLRRFFPIYRGNQENALGVFNFGLYFRHAVVDDAFTRAQAVDPPIAADKAWFQFQC